MNPLRIFMLIGFFVSIYGEANNSSPSYLILVPKVIQLGDPIILSITMFNDSPVLVKSEIIHENRTVSQTQSSFQGGTKLMRLPFINEYNSTSLAPYILNVTGYNGSTLVFSNSTILSYGPRKFSILLQTDKPKYKPGQDIKIRALIINPECKPYNNQMDILIKDPNDNLIRQWLAVKTVLGETAQEFQLSQNPPLGLWKILAKVNGVTQEMFFNVSNYELPKFEVLVDAPKVVNYEDMLNFTVTAQYLNKKPVDGNLSVLYVSNSQKKPSSNEEWKTIKGSTKLSFNLSSIFDYNLSQHIDIHVQVTEPLTGVASKSSVRVFVTRSKYHLRFQEYLSSFKPTLTFSAQLRLSTYNNTPLTAKDLSRNVTLNITQQTLHQEIFTDSILIKVEERNVYNFYENTSVESLQLPVPADGIIPFQFKVSENVSALKIEAYYEDVYSNLVLYRSYAPPIGSYIQLKKISSPKIGQILNLTVESNLPLTTFYYMVEVQGQIVASGNTSSLKFSLPTNSLWIPVANVLVYYVRPDGEIIYDVLKVSFEKILQNDVSVSWVKKQAEPAEQVSLSVSVAESQSLVGILVVDKASMNQSNDFIEKRVIEQLTGSKDVNVMEGRPFSNPYSLFMPQDSIVLTDLRPSPEVYYNVEHFENQFDEFSTSQHINQEPHMSHFPETWLWFDTNMSSTKATFNFTVPDSITSWVATAFVISENLGLGLSAPAELHVSKNFFVSLNLPSYLVRGELLVLEVNIFNYMNLDLEVLVKVENNSTFEFVSTANNSAVLTGVREVFVMRNNSNTALFPIKATQLGEMTISVSASSKNASDEISQTTVVKPEGREKSITQTLFLDLLIPSVTKKVEFYFPYTTIRGSQRAEVTAVADIMGPSINGLDSLIQMPYGCGEQNMIYFAPNVYVLQYMNESGYMDEKLRAKALSYMIKGYEQELSYQRKDGSFSAFGNSDTSGSTWLSAFVLRCFLQAQRYIFIDTTVLLNVTNWLQAQQQTDGSFKEPGRVIHTELQGGLDGPVSLTAYVLMALLENNRTNDTTVSAAINYLNTKLNQGITSNYSLCLVTYALALAENNSSTIAFDKLMNRTQIENGVPMWSSGGSSVTDSWQPRSADIEMASYSLLTFQLLGKREFANSLMRWLSQQRNHLGGYGSTQDTVIALQALSTFTSLSNKRINLTITVTNQTATVATFKINQTNYMLYQIQEIWARPYLQLNVTAVGEGFALFQFTTFYNEAFQSLSRRRRAATCEVLELFIDVLDNNMYNINLNICFWLCTNQELNQTGMAILDVGLLSGFTLAEGGVPINALVRKVETGPGNVILYLDSITKNKVCVVVPTTQEFKVTGVRDAAVTIYDYYEPRRRASKMYTSVIIRDMSYCSFCGVNCSQCKDTVSVNPVTFQPVSVNPVTLNPVTVNPVNVNPEILVFGGSNSLHYHQGLLMSLFLLLLTTFCF